MRTLCGTILAVVLSLSANANSVASFCERAEKGERLTVAFLGGSLSWGANATDPNKASWRALVGRRLEERYPDAHFKFIDAAIGGTDSGLGIFRLERDVMPCKPDIVFVEWLVNDGERKADDDSSCSYEGIIRHLMERLPGCVPVQVMLPTRGTIEEPDASKLVRWDEQKRIGSAYGLVRADVLGEMRRRHVAGAANLDRMWPAWPALIGDTTHPHDYGYSVYADIIWDQIFAKPSDKSPTMPDEWFFAPKYRHVVRENVAAWKDLPKGWHNDVCYVRAGTFDFLCSRWQDGLAVAANCAFNPKTLKRELVSGDVEPLRAKFRGEVLMLYGESAEWSPKCEVFVDGKRVAERDTADFGRMFAPTAYLVWKIGVSFDANAEHTLEIRPVFADGEPQEFRLGSICVAGRNAAWVRASAADIAVDGCADVRILQDVVTVTSTGAVSFVRLKIGESLAPEMKVLNDAWERSYGDLEWQTLGDKTICSPWYFLAEKDGKVQGFGVETGPGAMCCWEVSAKGVTLVLDVRAGGGPVRLNGRTLKACRIVRAESKAGESPWQFGRRFCRMMCPKPKLPKAPVYGYNDWYCAYGKNTATNFLADAEYIVSCAKGCANPPYVVMDDGWQKNSPPVVHESGHGPWDTAGANFGMEMPEFCRRIAALGAKPGLWYRPLRAWDELPEEQRLIADRSYLDPTVPAVQTRIVEDVRRFRDWGFKLVKIDFLSYDLAQIWPCDPLSYHDRYIQDDRKWRDDSRTTAEVMLDIYKAMKDAAGDDVVIIGCNAFNHLAAGVFELQRTGDDTSGKDWKRTRKNGVNTLAMRSIQDGAFFKIDADCVGLASEGAVPWNLNRQWMDLLGRSGTPFFISWRRELATPEVRESLSKAFRHASSVHDVAEPLDWFDTRQPRRWRFADGMEADYNW